MYIFQSKSASYPDFNELESVTDSKYGGPDNESS